MKKLGFGCMRLPMIADGSAVDYDAFNEMIDAYFEQGFNYFDTAHGYIGGKSETAIRDCLVKRYPRAQYLLTNKLTSQYFNEASDIRPLFEKQLEQTGVAYFDYYLMHALNDNFYTKFKACEAFETVKQLKAEGKIKHMGISFHDKAHVLERILSEQPDIEVVQIQFNYADYDDPGIESAKCYEICRRYNKPVIVMEPVRGGGLVNLPELAKQILDELDDTKSYANYAIRYCASFEGVSMVLSGMSNMAQMLDNTGFMKDFEPFNEAEFEAVDRVREVLKQQGAIRCTACQYCVDQCPKTIAIPDLFADYNAKIQFNDWNSSYYYGVHTKDKGKASDCIQCGLCEKVCPQFLSIREHLKTVSETFETTQS